MLIHTKRVQLILALLLILVSLVSKGQVQTEVYSDPNTELAHLDELCYSFKYSRVLNPNNELQPEVLLYKLDSLIQLFEHDTHAYHCDSVEISNRMIEKAFIYVQLNKTLDAERELVKVTTFNINKSYVRYAFGEIYRQGKKYKQAEDYLLPHSNDTTDPYYSAANESLGLLNHSLKKYDVAIYHLNKSLTYFEYRFPVSEGMPTLPEELFYRILRGDCYHELGKKSMACEDWNRAFALDTYKLYEKELTEKLADCK